MAKLTPWIKCRDQQPTLPGWYDVRWPGGRGALRSRVRWSGTAWTVLGGTHLMTFNNGKGAWRGLSSNPSAPKEAK